MDFVKKLFDRYPDSENPLKESAVLLVDEIDLHLHPQWQRTVIKYLSDIFPQTQFIVTTHSPFVIQSMEKVNLYTLQREGDQVKVNHLGCRSFIGWRIEEILSEVMGLGDDIQTDTYQELMKQFEIAANNEDYQQGKAAYDALKNILHPQSVERELIDIRMSQLIPDDKT
jgi:predicted ATP-binding protein involved in virulence